LLLEPFKRVFIPGAPPTFIAVWRWPVSTSVAICISSGATRSLGIVELLFASRPPAPGRAAAAVWIVPGAVAAVIAVLISSLVWQWAPELRNLTLVGLLYRSGPRAGPRAFTRRRSVEVRRCRSSLAPVPATG